MPSKIEEIGHGSMCSHESLGLSGRLELSPPLMQVFYWCGQDLVSDSQLWVELCALCISVLWIFWEAKMDHIERISRCSSS